MKTLRTSRLFLTLALMFLVSCSSTSRLNLNTNPFESEETLDILEQSKKSTLPVKLLYVNNVQGEIGTCGCAFAPTGGVDRRLNYLNSLISAGEDYIHLDSGSALFSTLVLNATIKSKQRQTASALAEAYGILGLHALNVGRYDLVEGHEFYLDLVKKHRLPAISTNLVDRNSRHLFPTKKELVTRNGVKALILGVSSVSRTLIPGLELRPEDPIESVKRELKNVGHEVLLVILSDLNALENETLLSSLKRPAIILGSTSFDSYAFPLHKEDALVGQTVAQGQELGELQLFWPSSGKGRWLNQSGFAAFSRRWKSLKAEHQILEQQEPSEFLEDEKAQNLNAFKSLLDYTPKPGESHIVYQARLITMDEKWAQSNKLSKIVRKFKK